MIQANVSSTQTMVNQRATEIRFKELTLFTDNLGVVASLAAFFAETSLESLYIEPETVAKSNPKNHFSTLTWSLSAVTISLNLLTLLVAIYTMLHGPAMAIRGPAGSMSLAVSRIFVQRKLALRLFWGGLLCKVVQAAALAAWRYPPEVAAAVCAVFACFIFATGKSILRVTAKFSFRQFGLRREDFIEIAVQGGRGKSAGKLDYSNNGGEQKSNYANTNTDGYNSRPGDVLSGWLMKQSAYLKRWNSRYFTLNELGQLKWSTSTAAPARGVLHLQDGIVDVQQMSVTTPGVPAYGLVISQRKGNVVHELVVATDSVEARARWTATILEAANNDGYQNPILPPLSGGK